jgi:hypothetical protein
MGSMTERHSEALGYPNALVTECLEANRLGGGELVNKELL